MPKSILNEKPWKVVLYSSAFLFPALAAFLILLLTDPGLPYQDDFHAILGFSLLAEATHGVVAKVLLALVWQYNEYKLMFEHLLLLIQLGVVHRIFIPPLNLLADIFVLAVPCIFWRMHQTEQPLADRLRTFVPLCFILLSLSYWEMLNWAMTSLQGLPVVCFAMLSIVLLTPARNVASTTSGSFAGACCCAVLASMSSANGFLLLPCGLLFLALNRLYRRAMAWVAAFMPPLACYLYHYTRNYEPHRRLIAKVFALVCFPGLVFPFRPLAFVLGAAIWSVILLGLLRHGCRGNFRHVYLALWVVLTSLVVAFVRVANASRYSIYSLLFLALCYSYWLEQQNVRPGGIRKRQFHAWVAASALLLIFSDTLGAYRLRQREQMILSGYRHYAANPSSNSPQVDPLVDATFPWETPYELQMLHQTSQTGVFVPPAVP